VTQANNAIAAANINIPSGNFEGKTYVYSVRADGRLYDVRDLQNLAVGSVGGVTVYLRDVANIEETAIKKTKISRISNNGQLPTDAVTLSVVKRTGGKYYGNGGPGKNSSTKRYGGNS